MSSTTSSNLSVAGLFAGIAGIERGLARSGHHAELLNEIDPYAQAVLRKHYPDVELVPDVRDIKRLPPVDLVAAGFPCQDLSQAGRTAGITGKNSGLVGEVFRLIEDEKTSPDWLLLENVPFMLRLDRGEAMRFLTDTLGGLGFRWAYRVVNNLAFGVPQRRHRVLLLASRVHDPREVLFHGSKDPVQPEQTDETAYGFYWTEGLRGLGWGVSCVPPLKGGSGVGIPSPPAIWWPDDSIVTPDIRDAERLQGFPSNWTWPAEGVDRRGWRARWRLVGNAVSVKMSEWVGKRLASPRPSLITSGSVVQPSDSWPTAAWGDGDTAWRADLSDWPVAYRPKDLNEFLRFPPKPLSSKAASGFLSRAQRSSLRFSDGFLEAVALQAEDG